VGNNHAMQALWGPAYWSAGIFLRLPLQGNLRIYTNCGSVDSVCGER
jgi:hypothetical protein